MMSILFLIINVFLTAQNPDDALPYEVTLSQCRSYALANQALIRQALLDEDITGKDIKISLSGWYPQIGFDASIQHYLDIPRTSYPFAPGISYPSSSANVSSGTFYTNQTLYSSNLHFAARNSGNLRTQASENTENIRINLYVNVTKAFFDVLLTQEQLNVMDEDILRLQQNYRDAYSLYVSGIRDNIDYQRTEISLSNAKAHRKAIEEALKAKYALLKQFTGVSPEKQLAVIYDTSAYENEILFDTTRILDYSKRIEYRLLETSLQLQDSQIGYYRWSFLPTLSAFYNYNPRYGNDRLSELYNYNNPASLVGLKLSLPLFQGLNRVENLSRAKLQYRQMQLGMEYLKSEMNSEYMHALSVYKSNLNEMRVAGKNMSLAKNIYNTVKLQYSRGTKAYLEVIVSETDLRTSELNYLNALYQVLASKIDLEKALGIINAE